MQEELTPHNDVPAAAELPLSAAQRDVWHAQKLAPGDPLYNIGGYVEIFGSVDRGALVAAVRQALGEADSHQFRFVETDAGPRQIHTPLGGADMQFVDLSDRSDSRAEATAWMQAAMHRPFDLSAGHLYRIALIKAADDRYFWFGVFHHLITDLFGTVLLMRRAADLYNASVEGKVPPAPDVTSWLDVLDDDAEYRASARYERDRSFWLEELRGRPEPATLSGVPPEWPGMPIDRVGKIPRSTIDRLAHLSEGAHGLAPILLAAVALYLSSVSGRRDVVLGMPVAARTNVLLRRASGFVSNVVPLRLEIDPAKSFAVQSAHTRERLRESLRHQRYWAGALRSDLKLASNEPNVYGLVFNFMPSDAKFEFAGQPVKLNPFAHSPRVEDLWITVHARDDGSEVELQFSGHHLHYDDESIAQHLERFLNLLETIVDQPGTPTGRLPLQSILERERILEQGSGADRKRPDQAVKRRGRPIDSGEVDAAPSTLPAPAQSGPPVAVPELPRTTTETRLAAIWCEVLRIEQVDRRDDFFESGGDSLLALQVVSRVRDAFRLELPLKALFDAPKLAPLAAQLDQMLALRIAERAAPLEAMKWESAAPIEPRTWEGPAPLSYSQERMWLIQTLSPGNTAYNIGAAAWLRGSLDVDALAASFDDLLLRHEILRSRLRLIDELPHQSIEPFTPGALGRFDLRGYEDPQGEALRRADSEIKGIFDLGNAPLIRARLYRTAEESFLLAVVLHHIVGDLWSMGVLGRELVTLYNHRRRGTPLELAPLPVSYRDFAHWQRSGARTAEIEQQLNFWTRRLADLPAVDLPTDYARPRIWTMNGAFYEREMPPELVEATAKLALKSSSTLFMTLFAGFATLLHRISGQKDIPIGVPVANRTHSEVEGLVGTFVNTVVFRTDLEGDPSFNELLARVRATALDAFANQDVSFDRLVQEIGQRGDRSRQPLVQVLFNVTNAPVRDLELDGMKSENVIVDRGGAQFELTFTFDSEITRKLTVEYNTDLFERRTIERLVGQFFTLLEAAAAAPQTRIGRLPISPKEQLAALSAWNSTEVSRPVFTSFVSLFEDQAARTPERIAIACEGHTLTYCALNARANRLARALKAAGVARGALAAVCMPRSPELLVSLLAAQKAGAAYLPLDPDLPAERLAYMLSDSGACALIAFGPLPQTLTVPDGMKRFDVNCAAATEPDLMEKNIPEGPKPQDAAYLLYTSGSTGRPKGVSVPHRALANFLLAMSERPGLAAADVLAAVTTVSFDIAGLELYLPLIVGARIELATRQIAIDAEALTRFLGARGATVFQATPTTWRMLVEAGWRGGSDFRALCGGEPLSRKLADEILDRAGELWNLYGPTETTIWSTIERVERGAAAISIGRPIDNTQVHILESGGEMAPIGVVGEICIGGLGVADGYHARPALTAERFTADAYCGMPGARLYRTGDLGRWGADGKLYHLGRADHQVKIRGFRIELGEIETVLAAHPAVRHAVAAVREARPDDSRLVAYVAFAEGEDATASDLKRYLRTRLPDYMIPSIIVALASMPQSPSGKVDRAALPDPFATALRNPALHEPPATPMEQILAEIWRSVLKIGRVEALDNFFELGGYSLLSLRVAKMVERRTGFRMDPRTLFFHNLREVAGILEAEASTADAEPM